VQKRYRDTPVVTTGTAVFYFHASHGASDDQVVYLRPDWKEAFGILGESLSAERTSYRGNVLGTTLSRVHHPENTEPFSADGTTGDKLIWHGAPLPTLAGARS
jgi:hypothetical protein